MESPTFGTLPKEDDFFFPTVSQDHQDIQVGIVDHSESNRFKPTLSASTHGSIGPALKAMDFNLNPSQPLGYKSEEIRPLKYYAPVNLASSKHESTDSDPSHAESETTFGSLSPVSTKSSLARSAENSNAYRPYTSYAGKLKVKYEQVQEEEDDDEDFHAYSDDQETVPDPNPHLSHSLSNQSMRNEPEVETPSRGLRINQEEANDHLRPSLPLRSGSLQDMDNREDGRMLSTQRGHQARSQSSLRGTSFDDDQSERQLSFRNASRTAGTLGGNSGNGRQDDPNDYSRLRRTIREVQARGEEERGSFRDARDVRDEDDDESSNDKFFRRAAHTSRLLDFIPASKAQPVHSKAGVSLSVANLPDWSSIRPGDQTSKPISNVRRDMDWSLRRLISRTVFESLLSDSLGRHRFREYLVRAEGTEVQLDLLFDLIQYQKMVTMVKESAEAIHDVYLASDSASHQKLPVEIDEGVFECIKSSYDLKLGAMSNAQNHLLNKFYANEFQSFIKNQLIEQVKVSLSSDYFDPNEMNGLGDSYCLTNPRLRENPIVMTSSGFESVSGYPRASVIGRNCRFLQGPSTNPASIQRIRDALNAGEPLTELILNYKLNGDPFWCLLNIIPLREANGDLAYFVGSQTNVTGTLAAGKNLSFLTAGSGEGKSEEVKNLVDGREVSATMARFLGAQHAAGSGVEISSAHDHGSVTSRASTNRRGGAAAGAYDPSKDSQHGYNSNMNVGMLAPPGMESGGMSGSTSKKSGFMKLFGKGNYSNKAAQRLPGAESSIYAGNRVGTIETQMESFSRQTSKLIIFRREKREVMFATPELVKYFGLPTATARQVLASPLVHADLLSLLRGNTKEDTKFLRSKVSAAISKGEGLSVRIGIRKPSKKWTLAKKEQDAIVTWTNMVVTPLFDRENSSFAMIALFG